LLAALGPDGLALVNGDDPRAVRCLQRAQASHRMRYGTAEVAECRLVERIPNTDGGASLRIMTPSGRTRNLTTSLVGLPGALAVTAAVAVVEALRPELSDETLQAALGSLGTGEGGRLQVREAQAGGAIVDDCYNANPASMRSSLGVARELAAARGRRLLLVLGEMRELGALSEAEHGRLAESLQSTERVVLVGEQMRHCAQAAKARGISTEYVADPAGAVAAVRALHRPGEIVLVKGSRGVRLERVVEALLADGGSSP